MTARRHRCLGLPFRTRQLGGHRDARDRSRRRVVGGRPCIWAHTHPVAHVSLIREGTRSQCHGGSRRRRRIRSPPRYPRPRSVKRSPAFTGMAWCARIGSVYERRRAARRGRADQPRPTAESTMPGATKRDLVDYLDAVADRMLPGLAGRPLTVLRVLRGQAPFMQKNVPKYTPDWVKTVPIWAEASKREVRYALCDDRRTLLWLANQRAVEYHPTLGLADNIYRPTHLVLDLDPPADDDFAAVVAVAHLVRQALADCGSGRRGEDQRREGHSRVRADRRPALRSTTWPRRPARSPPGRRRLDPAWRQRRSSSRTAAARCSWTRPAPAARPSPPPTAPAYARAHRCRFRWTGPNWTTSTPPTSRCTRRSTRLAGATRGPRRCPNHSDCRAT